MNKFRSYTMVLACLFSVGVCAPSSAQSQGASVPADATAGCTNQWLFNGVWRVQITNVEPYVHGGQPAGWQVTEVWRNGTTQGLAPAESFFKEQQLGLDNGSVAASSSATGAMAQSDLVSFAFAPAAQKTHKAIFLTPTFDPSSKPKTLDISFDASKLAQAKSKPQFSTSLYNFHFKLDCVADRARSQAQGGSNQIAAREGCMNQWESNGIWKMRVTGITPRYFSDDRSAQTGWLVKQEWANVSNRSLTTGSMNASAVVFATNVGDEYLVTQGGNNASSSNVSGDMITLAVHQFPPGGTFTYEQLFSWTPFDPTDKPSRLLVTFDAKKQNALTGPPHYRTMPANFRINLECSK